MACNECVIRECKYLYIHSCDTGINLGISVEETGDYTLIISFNQSVERLGIQAVAGVPIIIPNILNAPYVHELKIYDVDGNLVNDTCYMLHTTLAITPNNLTPNPICGAKKFITVTEDNLIDGILYDVFFDENVIVEIDTDNQVYLVDVGFTQENGGITWINDNRFYVGQVILAKA